MTTKRTTTKRPTRPTRPVRAKQSTESTPRRAPLLPAASLSPKTSTSERRAAIRAHVQGAISRELAATRAHAERRSAERVARKRAPVDVIASRDDWTPAAISRATGYTISHVTRVFHPDPKQRRWYVQACWLRNMIVGYNNDYGYICKDHCECNVNMTIDALTELVVEYGVSIPALHGAAVGFQRFAAAMQISVAELVAIVIGD